MENVGGLSLRNELTFFNINFAILGVDRFIAAKSIADLYPYDIRQISIALASVQVRKPVRPENLYIAHLGNVVWIISFFMPLIPSPDWTPCVGRRDLFVEITTAWRFRAIYGSCSEQAKLANGIIVPIGKGCCCYRRVFGLRRWRSCFW